MDSRAEPRRSQTADLMEVNYPLVLYGIQGSQYTAKVGCLGVAHGGAGVRGAGAGVAATHHCWVMTSDTERVLAERVLVQASSSRPRHAVRLPRRPLPHPDTTY